jgi:hypothetical protein
VTNSKHRYAGKVEAINSAGKGLRAEFVWFGDRFGHRIFGVYGTTTVHLLSSAESDQGELWPVSPPVQEFNDPYISSDINSGAVGLAVGAAGSSYWSMGIDVANEEQPALTFDVACRAKQKPEWLGSTYDLAEATGVSCGMLKVDIESAVGNYRVQAMAPQGSLELIDCLLHATDDRITLSCTTPDDLTPPITMRWQYRIGMRE